MSRDITPKSTDNQVILPDSDDKQVRTRLKKYYMWLEETGRDFLNVDLAAYRDYLLDSHSMKASSVGVYLATVRNRYRELIVDRDFFYQYVPEDLPFAERKSYVDEAVTRIENAIDARQAPVKIVKSQDVPDNSMLRLTKEQVAELMSQPDTDTLKGIRDMAVIALMLATGCRAGELTNLTVRDLFVWFGSEPALHIRRGKGSKERLVPYGDLRWLLDYVKVWLEASGITGGYVFRRVYKNGKSIGRDKLSEYSIELIVKSYPIVNDGEVVSVKPHDLRRTYARRAYDSGLEIYQIQKNMGHESEVTTKVYIGDLSASERKPPAIYGDLQDRLKTIKQSLGKERNA